MTAPLLYRVSLILHKNQHIISQMEGVVSEKPLFKPFWNTFFDNNNKYVKIIYRLIYRLSQELSAVRKPYIGNLILTKIVYINKFRKCFVKKIQDVGVL